MDLKIARQTIAAICMLPLYMGCSWFNKVPMDVLSYHQAEKNNRQMMVFMRGLGGNHHSFEDEGLVANVCDRSLPFDMVAPNAHFGYYWDRSLIQRMKEDVIAPAHAAGYDDIWLVGFSMGGLGALLYTLEHPEDVQGICLISPFLGYPGLLKKIKAAGGVRQWDPGTYDPEKQWQKMLWQWLKEGSAEKPNRPVFLGFGLKDPYVLGHTLLADILPEERVFTVPGGHDYESFKSLWRMFLEKLSFVCSGNGAVDGQPASEKPASTAMD